MSLTEVLTRVREHITGQEVTEEGQAAFAAVLAVATGEDVDFILGAIKPQRWSANIADMVERKVRGRKV